MKGSKRKKDWEEEKGGERLSGIGNREGKEDDRGGEERRTENSRRERVLGRKIKVNKASKRGNGEGRMKWREEV